MAVLSTREGGVVNESGVLTLSTRSGVVIKESVQNTQYPPIGGMVAVGNLGGASAAPATAKVRWYYDMIGQSHV